MKKNTIDMINIVMIITAIAALLIVNLFPVSDTAIMAFRVGFGTLCVLNAILFIKVSKIVNVSKRCES